MSQDESSSDGIGFTGWLTLLFIALKLMGFIDWSWWWVLLPVWIWIPLLVTVWAIAEIKDR